MKTTTYIFANGTLTKTVSDQPELTPEQYASACAVIRKAASQHVASLKASRPMHESEQIALMRRVAHSHPGVNVDALTVAELIELDKDLVICVRLNVANNTRDNRVYSTYVADLYRNECPFQDAVPCWSR